MSPALSALMEGCRYPGKGVMKGGMKGRQKGGVMLEPFVHQVGGHSAVLCCGKQTICKPLVPRELQFYKSLPPEIRSFIPQYRGVVSVSFEEDEEGTLSLMAYPLHSGESGDHDNQDLTSDPESRNKKGRPGRTDEKTMSNGEKQGEVLCYRMEKGNVTPQVNHVNPWSLQCHQQHLQRMQESSKHRNQHKFILLENLTWQFHVPCVLDLKMGTRQHGDDASEEKKQNQIRKCQQSTSASIGVRLCGMQVYHSNSGQLRFMNKYHGRKLSLGGFKEALYQFFSNGGGLRGELLSPVLRRLREMQAMLEACESYRFFSSSLLILYDGAPAHPAHARAHTQRGGEEGEEDEPSDEEEEEEAFGCPQRSRSSAGIPGGPAVDVRMIDFAHTTCRHYREDSVRHEGGDSGYIFGLQNLISILSQLQQHSTD